MKKIWLIIIITAMGVVGYFVFGIDQTDHSTHVMCESNECSVSIGESVMINDVEVTLHSVVADYRCPVDTQCPERGAIVANVTLESGDQTQTFNMPSDEAPREFANNRISILKIEPELLSSGPTEPGDYILTFRVTE